jgi:phage tail-like protein
MKASNASPDPAGSAASGPAQPLAGLRFRVEIDGLAENGAVEVVLPAARLVARRNGPSITQLEPLFLRRGLTRSTEWSGWWEAARRGERGAARRVRIVLLDDAGADARSWSYAAAVPVAYAVSPLHALVGAVVIESLELRVTGLALDAPRARRRRGR